MNGKIKNKTLKYQKPSSRRDFIKLLGYGAGVTALLPACEQPIRKMIPYLVQPEDLIPGKAFHYATTFKSGNLICPIVAKLRDGRPIKIEGNELSQVTSGGTNARVQASILDLYNPTRLQKPISGNNVLSWDEVDQQIIAKLEALKDKKIALVTETICSPSEKKIIDILRVKYPNIELLEIDFISNEAIRMANIKCFDLNAIPIYHFEKADFVVGFNADFLSTWISPIEFAKQYSTRKNPDENLLNHVQFESTFTITGAAADKRFPINPSEEKPILVELLSQIKTIKASEIVNLKSDKFNLKKLADNLLKNKGKSLIVSGTNSVEIQILVNAINFELENLGATVDFNNSYCIGKGKAENLNRLINGLNNGNYFGAIFYKFDFGFLSGNSENLFSHIEKLDLSVFIGTNLPEKSKAFKYVLPANHFLESWSDYETKHEYFSLGQPLIKPLFNTRQAEEILKNWAGIETSYHDFMKTRWEEETYTKIQTEKPFNDFWNETLQKGVLEKENREIEVIIEWDENVLKKIQKDEVFKNDKKIEIHLFESSVLGDGNQISNPWILELPDPISKQCWGNAALISPEFAKKHDLINGQHIEILLNKKVVEIPVLVLPGQASNTISVALGFGKSNSELGKTGSNVNYFVQIENGIQKYNFFGDFRKIEKHTELAIGQLHDSMEGRELIKFAKSDEFAQNPELFKHRNHFPENPQFYKKPEFLGYHWGLAVDLNKCTGCSTCVIACQAENNIPVVGKNEVINKHEMHWLRVDRYFNGDLDKPRMLVQPVMCQHCDNAPCENVCPVSATTHSSEGINQMVYNRCIGTRYCANNCPYKVRRFNWYDYNNTDMFKNNEVAVLGMGDDLTRMVLNPDVTQRSRGVIEKCTFCIQRIIDVKNKAKLENRPVFDGEIKMACEQSCPSDALVFGNMNDAESRISKLIKSNRSYRMLEELSTESSVFYQAKIINSNS